MPNNQLASNRICLKLLTLKMFSLIKFLTFRHREKLTGKSLMKEVHIRFHK